MATYFHTPPAGEIDDEYAVKTSKFMNAVWLDVCLSDVEDSICLTPSDARALASELVELADEVDPAGAKPSPATDLEARVKALEDAARHERFVSLIASSQRLYGL